MDQITRKELEKSKYKECNKKEYNDFFASLRNQAIVLHIIQEMQEYKKTFNVTNGKYIIPAGKE
ncbi:MAG: hypothetical protein Q8N21_00830 [bacterium]|nr:hypothetical protein [bacterium]